MSFFLRYFILLLGIALGIKSESASVVQTKSGPVRGTIEISRRKSITYASFKGIPYAEPPVGYLRFKPPVEKKPWLDVLNATDRGNTCIQYDRETEAPTGSEDCLFLDVFTPHTDLSNIKQNELKAVMVWIYGGGFNEGSTSIYGHDYLLEEDVVVVTINYRVGLFGFINLGHENATGNAGLKDQNLALRWVNKNIAQFGGDPKKVTIFGQSAGAVSVDLHVLSEMSTGLFRQSIAMSGSALCFFWATQSRGEAKHQAFTLGSKLGIHTLSRTKLLEKLYETPAEDIVMKAHEMSYMPFRPTIEKTNIARNEKKFLTKCTVDKYRSGNYNKGPHMTGFTSVEAKSFAEAIFFELLNAGNNSNSEAFASHKALMQQALSTRSFANLPQEALETLTKLVSELFFVTGIDSKQKLMQRNNRHPIYYYRFSFQPKTKIGLFTEKSSNFAGVGHGEDLPFLFYIPFVKVSLEDPEIRLVTDRYVRLITNFAKFGNPTPNGNKDPLLNVTWPESGLFGKHLEISNDLTVGPRPTSPAALFDEFIGLGTSRHVHHCYGD